MTELETTEAAATPPSTLDTLRSIGDVLPHLLWSTTPDGAHDYYNVQWYEYTGVPVGSTDGDGWNGMFHPEDQARAWDVWRHSLATGEPYRIEYRLRHRSGQYRWVLGRAHPVRGPDGAIRRWIGTCTDIDDARRIAEQNSLLSQELDHRIKNLFAIVGSLVRQALRPFPALAHVATDLHKRIIALGQAQQYVRPGRDDAPPPSLHGMLGELLAPYSAADTRRIRLAGDDIAVFGDAATPIALAVHELATNAAKYGALAAAAGSIELDVTVDAELVTLAWREDGDGATPAAPGALGFGTRLIDLAVTSQLGGVIERNWTPRGLHATLRFPVDKLRASRAAA